MLANCILLACAGGCLRVRRNKTPDAVQELWVLKAVDIHESSMLWHTQGIQSHDQPMWFRVYDAIEDRATGMSMMLSSLRFGTRGSDLALWQTMHVMSLLQAAIPTVHVAYEIIKTRGDHILDTPLPLMGGKGVFTAELEAALYDKRIDCAVHSLKDLPTENPAGLVIGAIAARANPADVLVNRIGDHPSKIAHSLSVTSLGYCFFMPSPPFFSVLPRFLLFKHARLSD